MAWKCFRHYWHFVKETAKFPTWWRHEMETFSALLALCAGNSPVDGEFPAQRPVTRGFDIFFDLHLNKRFSKQSWGWWFETSSRSLWRHRDGKGPVMWNYKGNPPITGRSPSLSAMLISSWLPVDSSHKATETFTFDVSIVVSLNKLLNTQPNCL